jgi:sigma-B regulation protein RsbU (phosphoserine phosphatase)
MSSLQTIRGLSVPPARDAKATVVDIDAISRPARTFTGDFYFTHRHEDRTWLALGDVAGKGLPAAIVMAMIQEELEERIAACAETLCDPATTIARLHDFLLPLMPQNRFATGVIATLRDDGLLTVANGGHCPPLILRADGTIEELASTGPILGLLPKARWRSVNTTLDYGDILILYSDGVTEATRDGEELGVCGLRRVVRKASTAKQILDALSAYAHGDDTTVVVVRRV